MDTVLHQVTELCDLPLDLIAIIARHECHGGGGVPTPPTVGGMDAGLGTSVVRSDPSPLAPPHFLQRIASTGAGHVFAAGVMTLVSGWLPARLPDLLSPVGITTPMPVPIVTRPGPWSRSTLLSKSSSSVRNSGSVTAARGGPSSKPGSVPPTSTGWRCTAAGRRSRPASPPPATPLPPSRSEFDPAQTETPGLVSSCSRQSWWQRS